MNAIYINYINLFIYILHLGIQTRPDNIIINPGALIKITNMLSQNPEVQDLFITLAALPDDKRKHAINALNTLITSLQ